MVSVHKLKNSECCEFLNPNYIVFSRFGHLRLCKNDEAWTTIKWFRVASFWEFLLSLVPLMSRLLRLQFYNVIKFKNGIFVCWSKRIYWISLDGKKELILNSSKFRIFRNGCCVLRDNIYFGEYFGNPQRNVVKLYKFNINTKALITFKTFPSGQIRHIHSVRKSIDSKLLVFTGDLNDECKIIKIDPNNKKEFVLGEGGEDYRAIYGEEIALNKILYATDAEFQENKLLSLENGSIKKIYSFNGPVFYGSFLKDFMFFSVVMEGAPCQIGNKAEIFCLDIKDLSMRLLLAVEKDLLSKRYFQFGQFLFPYIEGEVNKFWVKGLAIKNSRKEIYEISF